MLCDLCEQVTAVTSELSDERFRGDAVGQALDVERAERLRLSRENKELQVDGQVICYSLLSKTSRS